MLVLVLVLLLVRFQQRAVQRSHLHIFPYLKDVMESLGFGLGLSGLVC